MTEFGSLALVDDGAGDEDGVDISLPGVRKGSLVLFTISEFSSYRWSKHGVRLVKGDMSSRHFKPEIRVSSLRFSPTGRSWAAATTEGLLVYSLDGSLVFDPYDLDLDVTPASIRKQLRLQEWASAIVLAFRLNENALKQEVLETVPQQQSGFSFIYLSFMNQKIFFPLMVKEKNRKKNFKQNFFFFFLDFSLFFL